MFALGRALLLADVVGHDALAQAMLASARDGCSLVRALLATGAVSPSALEPHLGRSDVPHAAAIDPAPEIATRLPTGLCERLLAVPLRTEAPAGTVDLAVADAHDGHAAAEVAYWLACRVRVVHTSLSAMDAALAKLRSRSERGLRSLAPPIWFRDGAPADDSGPRTPPYGTAPSPDPVGTDVAFIELGDPGRTTHSSGPPGELTSGLWSRYPEPRGGATTRPNADDDVGEAQPPTVRGPYSLERREGEGDDPLDLEPLRVAADRDQLLDGVVAAVARVARRVAIFAVRREGIVGWTCSPGLTDKLALRSLRWPASSPTLLHSALTARGVVLARLPVDGALAPLTALMARAGGAPHSEREVALAAVVVEGKPVAIVLADELVDALVATERLQQVTRVAGDSLERLLRQRHR